MKNEKHNTFYWNFSTLMQIVLIASKWQIALKPLMQMADSSDYSCHETRVGDLILIKS